MSSSKKRLILLSGFLTAFLVVFNFSTYLLYKRAKDYLDYGLGERLRSIAASLAHTVELSSPTTLTSETINPSLYTLLHMVQAENFLSNIVILTPEGTTVVDLGGFFESGELNPFIELDFSAVTLARSGLSSYTGLYKSGDVYMKSAYAPITNPTDDVIGIVGVEAGAGFFEVLKALRRAIFLVDFGSTFLILLLAILFYRQSLSLDRAQEAILKGENLAAIGRMVAGIAHEIRNPLSIIKTSADHLQKKYGVDDEVFSYISDEVDKLNGVLTGYLNFARAEDSSFIEVSMQKIIRRCLLILEPEFKSRAFDLILKLPDEDVIVWGNERRLQQAILNLLLNSLQAADKDGRIEITLSTKAKHAVVVLGDNGCGIEKKDLKEVMKPFFTRKAHGSGLGLSIASSIVQEHGGTIDIQSEPGKGTTISISIQLAETKREPASKRKAKSDG